MESDYQILKTQTIHIQRKMDGMIFNAVVQLGEPSSIGGGPRFESCLHKCRGVRNLKDPNSCEFESHPRLLENRSVKWLVKKTHYHGKEKKSGMVTSDNHQLDSYWTKKKGECRWCGKKITKTPTERRGKEINMRKSW